LQNKEKDTLYKELKLKTKKEKTHERQEMNDERNRILTKGQDAKFAGWLSIMLASLEEKKFCDENGKITKTTENNRKETRI
jgi:hypothetical protein